MDVMGKPPNGHAANTQTRTHAMATSAPKKKPAAKKAPAKKPAAKAASAAPAKKVAAPKAAAQDSLKDQAKSLVGQASEKAKGAANQGKDKATSFLDELSKMVADVAGQIDDKVGANYGDMARKASSSVSGLASNLKAKDVDDLIDDARKFVREKPAVAIGAAAAVGFILTRLIKAGSDDNEA
jgi:ElaB/YqjD/DUF883 family membrane-anchored ribosome-binding protein